MSKPILNLHDLDVESFITSATLCKKTAETEGKDCPAEEPDAMPYSKTGQLRCCAV